MKKTVIVHKVVSEFSLTVRVSGMMQLSAPLGVIMGIPDHSLYTVLPGITLKKSQNYRSNVVVCFMTGMGSDCYHLRHQ